MSAPAARHAAPPRRRRWQLVAAVAVVASAAGVGAAAAGARWSDERVEVLPPPVTTGAVDRPVLRPDVAPGSEAAGATYAMEPYAAATRTAVLGLWGVGADAAADGTDLLAIDGAVHHAAPCDQCEGVPGVVLGGRRSAPANSVHVIPYPRADDALADECRFTDVTDGELPVAVVTGNPGEVELRVGAERYVIESDDDEVDEWEVWLDGPAGDRPAGSFVVHCVAVDAPAGDDPVALAAVASDGTGATVRGAAAVLGAGGGAPVVLRPLDATMLLVDVPLAEASTPATVSIAAPGPGCAAPVPAAGWRPGAEWRLPVAGAPGDRPYLAGTVAVLRRTVAVPEGEPTVVCVDVGGERRAVVVTPPDARRLTLTASATGTPAELAVEGTFTALGWSPCRGVISATAPETVLCASGGDTGAVAAADGLLDVTVGARGEPVVARLALSAAPGSTQPERYRIEAPGGGTVEVVAAWSDGATGAGDDWVLGRAAPAED